MEREEAIASYDRRLEANPRDVKVWHKRVTYLVSLGHVDEALACFKYPIAKNPPDAEAWFYVGLAHSKWWGCPEMLEQAVLCFDRALQFSPRDPQIWREKAEVLLKLSRCDESMACYKRAVELDLTDEKLLQQQIQHTKRVLEGNAHKLRDEEAVACCDRLIELDPKDANAWQMKGDRLYMLEVSKALHLKSPAQVNPSAEAKACWQRAKQLGFDRGFGREQNPIRIPLCRHRLQGNWRTSWSA